MNRKNGFFTFCCACVPGAGQMYLGYMKRGLSIMCAMFGVIAVASFFRMDVLLFALPIIWFYAFFDTFTLRNQTAEQLAANPDDYMFHTMDLNLPDLFAKKHKVLGVVLIFVGVYALYSGIIEPFLWQLSYDFWGTSYLIDAFRAVPTVLLAALLIYVGVKLAGGPANVPNDDFTAYKGESNHDDTDHTAE